MKRRTLLGAAVTVAGLAMTPVANAQQPPIKIGMSMAQTGGLAGGGKGALIGGLLGAGAGTAGAAFTGNKDVVIPSESVITFHLTAPVTITVQPKATDTAPPPPQ